MKKIHAAGVSIIYTPARLAYLVSPLDNFIFKKEKREDFGMKKPEGSEKFIQIFIYRGLLIPILVGAVM